MSKRVNVGDKVWKMYAEYNRPDEWTAKSKTVAYVDEHKFFCEDGTGGSMNSIGRNWFLTEEDAVKDHERYRW